LGLHPGLHFERPRPPRLHFASIKLLNFYLNADTDPAFHSNVDPDPAFHSIADPDPAFHINADPYPAFHSNADPDPAFKNNAEPCRSGSATLVPIHLQI
jgi:hypothetical protein